MLSHPAPGFRKNYQCCFLVRKHWHVKLKNIQNYEKKTSKPYSALIHRNKKTSANHETYLYSVFFTVLQVSANVYSQTSVTLDLKDKSIREVLKPIEQADRDQVLLQR